MKNEWHTLPMEMDKLEAHLTSVGDTATATLNGTPVVVTCICDDELLAISHKSMWIVEDPTAYENVQIFPPGSLKLEINF